MLRRVPGMMESLLLTEIETCRPRAAADAAGVISDTYRVLPRLLGGEARLRVPRPTAVSPQRTICSLMLGRSCGPVSAATS